MEFYETLRRRHSVRAYHGDPIEPGAMERILGAANLAPSAGGLQAYQVYLVQDPAAKEALCLAAYDQSFIEEAPVVLVFCAAPARAKRYGERGAALYAIQDATIAAAYVQLAAAAEGLSTCWVGAFDEGRACAALGAPEGERPVVILPLGRAAEEPAQVARRPLDELVRRVR